MRKITSWQGITSVFLVIIGAQAVSADSVPFTGAQWEIEAQESAHEQVQGKAALMLKGGRAVLRDSKHQSGVIEFDMLFKEQRGFSGAVWWFKDDLNMEQFYVRPHQSGNPDANQYQPVFNGNASWQLYYGPQYATPVNYRFDEWVHVKIAFSAERVAFYIDSDEPVFVTDAVKQKPFAGPVGVYASGFAPAWFTSFEYRALAEGDLPEVTVPPLTAPEHKVAAWQVSSTFNWGALDGVQELTEATKTTLSWDQMTAETAGVINIARIRLKQPEHNSVFARLRIESSKQQRIPLTFGYSDVARVFMNDQLLYEGSNMYESRDYRYLGTIGLFETVLLPLHAGVNELWIAVGESFGGWGVQAQLEQTADVKLLP